MASPPAATCAQRWRRSGDPGWPRCGVTLAQRSCRVVLRALIVDDNASFLEAASRLLERQGLTITGVASSVEEALAKVQELKPDVVLVDIGLGSESGFDLARRLADSGSAVVLISTRSEADYARLIADAPAAGFVPKSELSAAAIRGLVSEP